MDLNPKVPPAVSNLVMECIAQRQQKRPADMDEVITRLELGKHILMKQGAGSPQGSTPAGDETPVKT